MWLGVMQVFALLKWLVFFCGRPSPKWVHPPYVPLEKSLPPKQPLKKMGAGLDFQGILRVHVLEVYEESPKFWLLLVSNNDHPMLFSCNCHCLSCVEGRCDAKNATQKNVAYVFFWGETINYLSKWRFWCILAFSLKCSFAVLQIWELVLVLTCRHPYRYHWKKHPKRDILTMCFDSEGFFSHIFLTRPKGYFRMICQEEKKKED